jgi:hypothetical protein
MNTTITVPITRVRQLPASLPVEGAIRIELQEGIPVLRASSRVQQRIEHLLYQQQQTTLSAQEQEELDRYEEIDDYLSLLNRLTRNLYLEPTTN